MGLAAQSRSARMDVMPVTYMGEDQGFPGIRGVRLVQQFHGEGPLGGEACMLAARYRASTAIFASSTRFFRARRHVR